jgi:uncharacterized alkaline shock family protein YloU
VPPRDNPHFHRSGTVTYGRNVLLSIITLAVKEISGVVGLGTRGVNMDIGDDTISADVFINILSSHNVSDIAYRVQENVKRSIETMSGYKVGSINVTILGVAFSEEN